LTKANKTIFALGWNFFNQIGTQGANFLFSIYLARLLSPTEYGLIAMVTVFTGFIGLFINFGFGSAAIQRDKTSNVEWSTIFHINLFFGAVALGLFYILAPAISSFYAKPALTDITRLLGIGVFISSLSIVFNNRLTKSVNFKSISIVNLIAVVASGVVGVYLAKNGYGVYALVYQRICSYAFTLVGLWIANTFWLPKIAFSFQYIRQIFSYSFFTFLSGILSFSTRNLDNLLIGKFLGDKSLGEYNRAYSFLMFPITMISRVVTTVLFPSFSMVKNDLEKVKSSFLKVSLVVSAMTIPAMVLLFICSDEIVYLVFGQKWMAIAPLIQAFSFMGVYQSILSLNGPLYTALGHVKLDFKVALLTEVVVLVAIFIGINWGINGVITGLYAAMLINFVPSNYFIFKKVNLNLREYYKSFLPNFLFTLALGGLIMFLFNHIDNTLSSFLIKAGLFTTLYPLYHFATKSKEFRLIMKSIQMLRKRGEDPLNNN
jgi:O-antigen/teichoic acid export membrane protein